ncbi:MAG: type I secretion C-terminal target domain-containing protein, partial [Acinetobacter sp.]
ASTQSPPLNFEIDTIAPIGGTVTIDVPVAGDNIVDSTEAAGNITLTGTVTIPVDAVSTVITVTVNGQDYPAIIDAGLVTWTAIIPGSQFADGPGDVHVEAVFTDAAGNVATDLADVPYTLDIPAVLSDDILAGTGSNPPVTGSTIKAGANLSLSSIITTLNENGVPIVLSVGGVPLLWSGTGTLADPLVAKANGVDILTISLTDTGDFSIIQSHSLDHSLAGADKLSIILTVLSNGSPHDILQLDVVDGIPVAEVDAVADLTQTIVQGLDTLTVSIPQTYRGSAVETFGGDAEGAHVAKVTVEGVDFSYDGSTVIAPISFIGTNIVSSHTVTDGSETSLIVTTVRGETVTVNLETGTYTVDVTGQGLSVNAAPEANIAGSGGLLGGGLISANALGVVDLTQTQTFSVSDGNENLVKVDVGYESSNLVSALQALVVAPLAVVTGALRALPLGAGNALANTLESLSLPNLLTALVGNPLIANLSSALVQPLVGLLQDILNGKLVLEYDAQVATELGLKVTVVDGSFNNGFQASLVIEPLTSGTVVDSLSMNQLLGTVNPADSGGGLLDLLGSNFNLLSTLKLQAYDFDSATSGLESQNLTIQLGLLDGAAQSNTIVIKDNGSNLNQSGATSSVQIYGLAGDDTITGSNHADIIRGGVGNDTINGGAGNDIIIGGKGNDLLTGGLGRDVFRWEAGDSGTVLTPAVDTITDFDIRSVAQGGDVLDLASLLPNANRVGTNTVNISQYLEFIEVGTTTEIHISSTGNTASAVDQIIVLNGVQNFVSQFANQEELISYLLKTGKLVLNEQTVDQTTYDLIKGDNELNIGIHIQDGDGDQVVHGVDLTVGSLEDANLYLPDFDPNNVAPEISLDLTELLGLVGADALGLLDLSRQAYSVIDVNDNLQRVELVYQPVVNVGLTRAYYEVSTELATELGLHVESVTNGG